MTGYSLVRLCSAGAIMRRFEVLYFNFRRLFLLSCRRFVQRILQGEACENIMKGIPICIVLLASPNGHSLIWRESRWEE